MIRIAWTENQGEMAVMWTSWLPLVPSWLEYRDCEEQWISVSPARTVFAKYKLDIYVEIIYTAVASDLEFSCNYTYRVGAGPHLWSKSYAFSGLTPYYNATNPINTVGKYNPRLAIFGDMGIGNFSKPTRSFLESKVNQGSIDAILHLGDIGYDLDRLQGRVADQFLHEIEPIASRIPYMVMPGNHEHRGNFSHYSAIFRMPRNSASGDTNFFYSFNIGKGHFICINSEAYFYLSQESITTQYHWLEADLAAAEANRALVPWVFVCMHKPLYCQIDWRRPMEESHDFKCNYDCDHETKLLRGELEDLFYRYSVDVVFAGHMHNYEREVPIYQNETVLSEVDELHYHRNPNAQVSILSGSAGSDHLHDALSSTPQLWSVINVNNYGFGLLSVLNSSHIYWEQLDSQSHQVVDYVFIEKTRETYSHFT